jgi:hypothetical protein
VKWSESASARLLKLFVSHPMVSSTVDASIQGREVLLLWRWTGTIYDSVCTTHARGIGVVFPLPSSPPCSIGFGGDSWSRFLRTSPRTLVGWNIWCVDLELLLLFLFIKTMDWRPILAGLEHGYEHRVSYSSYSLVQFWTPVPFSVVQLPSGRC